MSKIDNNSNNNNQIQRNYLIWLFTYMVIGFVLSFILPFPISICILLLVLFLLNIIRTELTLRKTGFGGIRGWYKSEFGRGGGTNAFSYNPLKFYCMNCGKEHRKIACPKCGSKAVSAG